MVSTLNYTFQKMHFFVFYVVAMPKYLTHKKVHISNFQQSTNLKNKMLVLYQAVCIILSLGGNGNFGSCFLPPFNSLSLSKIQKVKWREGKERCIIFTAGTFKCWKEKQRILFW
eukprot:TRINITY_DN71951_c1_g1_i2.p4 TRINITY_DN71951_c1_g1~~TRINITY_DN71951_c1_g1_i2.p4  ORF type:complete len:114 (+),score=3.26 TRINITY_DN71951_c1_g1_i2:935-1276(+)